MARLSSVMATMYFTLCTTLEPASRGNFGKDILNQLLSVKLVPRAGIEPARLAARDFESRASTNSTTRATQKLESQIMAHLRT